MCIILTDMNHANLNVRIMNNWTINSIIKFISFEVRTMGPTNSTCQSFWFVTEVLFIVSLLGLIWVFCLVENILFDVCNCQKYRITFVFVRLIVWLKKENKVDVVFIYLPLCLQ